MFLYLWTQPVFVNRYKRTRESLSHAGQVTTAALSSVGVAITRRLGEMRYPAPLCIPDPPLSLLLSTLSYRPFIYPRKLVLPLCL